MKWGPDFNGRVFAIPDQGSCEPVQPTRDLEADGLAHWLNCEADHQERIAARYKAGSQFQRIYLDRAHVFRSAGRALASSSPSGVAEPVATVHVFESTMCNGRKIGRIRGWDDFVKSLPVGDHPLYRSALATLAPTPTEGIGELERIIALRDKQLTDETALSSKFASRFFEAQAEASDLRRKLEEARKALEEFGSSRVRDRVAARVGCNHDILHDALQQEVRRALQEGGE